jgi:hypothetical protein
LTTNTNHPTLNPHFWTRPVYYPALQQRSILEPLPLGVRATDGRTATATFRENNAAVWGPHASGRTTALLGVTTGLLQCADALVWTIGTDVALPLLRRYGAGVVTTPCIDWVAPTLDEACTMAGTALTIALHRRRAYAELKYEHNTNVMPVGDGAEGNPPPAIIIVVGGDAPRRHNQETKRLYDLLRMVDDLGRDSGVRVVYSGLRLTHDLPAPLPGIRIAMRPRDGVELAHAFDDWELEPITAIGGGYLRDGDFGDAEPFLAYYLDQVRLSEVGEQTAPWRPRLDTASVAVAAEVYAFRWQRTAADLWVNPPSSAQGYQGIH